MRRPVITGRAVSTPLGDQLAVVVDAWRSGKTNFVDAGQDLKAATVARYIGACPSINLNALPDRKVQKAITRKDLIGLVTALAAASDAGVVKGQLNPERLGMFVGTGSTHVSDLMPYSELIDKCMVGGSYNSKVFGSELIASVNPMVMLQTLMNNTLCYASVALDVRGVNANFVDFQVAGMRALNEAMHAIVSNRADVVLVGGCAGKPEPFQAEEGVAMGYLAKTNDDGIDPKGVVRPFDAKRLGTILSEGSVFLVIEDEEHAKNRGAKIHGYLSDMAFFSEAGFAFGEASTSKALERSMAKVLAQESFKAKDLSFVVAHANGAKHGDYTEAEVYKKIFDQRIADIAVHSPKGAFGELTEAGPLLNIILAIDALEKNTIPATLNYDYGDNQTAPLRVTKELTDIANGFGLVTSRSFSGICTSVGVRIEGSGV